MITFDLECRSAGHRFEGWFGSSDDYAQQQQRGLVACPQCGSIDVIKAPMAPNIARKGNQLTVPVAAVLEAQPASAPTMRTASSAAMSAGMSKDAIPPEAIRMMQAMAAMQARALEKS